MWVNSVSYSTSATKSIELLVLLRNFITCSENQKSSNWHKTQQQKQDLIFSLDNVFFSPNEVVLSPKTKYAYIENIGI